MQHSAEEDNKLEENESEFTKPMMYLYDEEELKERYKERMYGNMFLITELYTAGQLHGGIIKTCLDDLQQEVNDQNVEIMCYMTDKLMYHLCKTTKKDLPSKGSKEKKGISIDYADNMCHSLFEHRKNENLEARIRFKIQDLIDMYNKEWRRDIADIKNRQSDTEGFKKIYVAKDQVKNAEEGGQKYKVKGY